MAKMMDYAETGVRIRFLWGHSQIFRNIFFTWIKKNTKKLIYRTGNLKIDATY